MTPDKVEAALGVLRVASKRLRMPGTDGIAAGPLTADELDEALATLTSALAERERDAARYRWLRDSAHPDAEASGAAVMEQRFGDWGRSYFHHFSGDSLDTEIDTAMKDTDCGLSDAEIDATTDYRGHDPDYDRKDTDHARRDPDGMDKAIREACQPDPEWSVSGPDMNEEGDK